MPTRHLFFCIFFSVAALQASPPEHVQIASSATEAFISQSCQDYDLLVYGHGGAMATKIENISIKFLSKKELTIDDFRYLVVHLVENFIFILNKTEKIEQYSVCYPLEVENVDISVKFEPKTNNEGYKKPIRCSKVKDTLTFYADYDIYEKDVPIIHKELYKDALELVQTQNPGIDLTARLTEEQKQKWRSQKIKREKRSFLQLLR